MALSANHEQGFFLLSRSLFESDIWCLKPPEYAKLFVYLIGKAAHTDRQYGGYKLKRGQCFCSSTELEEHIRYNVGWRKAGKSASTAKRILTFLRETGRITTKKEPRGVLITLLNYDQYQVSANYERTSEKTAREPRASQKQPPINKKVNNAKNDNYVALREKIVRHLATCDIENAEGYMRSIEQKFPPVAVEKASKDWCVGSGITSPSLFYARVKHYAEKANKQEQKAAAVIQDFLSSSDDADS
jgi:hypothetical protein